MKAAGTFETSDCDLAAFLMLQGLKFIECKLDETPGSKPKVVMRFFDEKQSARDLERVFMSSEMKRYEECRKYILKEIHRTLKGL